MAASRYSMMAWEVPFAAEMNLQCLVRVETAQTSRSGVAN